MRSEGYGSRSVCVCVCVCVCVSRLVSFPDPFCARARNLKLGAEKGEGKGLMWYSVLDLPDPFPRLSPPLISNSSRVRRKGLGTRLCPGRSSATHATKRQTRHTHGLSIRRRRTLSSSVWQDKSIPVAFTSCIHIVLQ